MGNKTSKLATPDAKNYFSRTFKLETPQFKYFAKKKIYINAKPSLECYLREADRGDISRYKMAPTIMRCFRRYSI